MRQTVHHHQKQRRAQHLAERIDAGFERSGELAIFVGRLGARKLGALLDQLRLDTRIVGRARPFTVLARANRVQRQVHRDPVNPGERFAAPVEPIQGAVGSNERVLSHVLSFRGAAQKMQRQSIDPLLVSAHHHAERFDIALLCSLDELAIRPLRHFRVGAKAREIRVVGAR